MTPPHQTQTEHRTVVINKPALQAWLQSWTTGETFISATHPRTRIQQKGEAPSEMLRRLRLKAAR